MTDTTATLKTLVDTTHDSVQGYEKAAEKAESAHLKQLLSEKGRERRALFDRLNAELVRLGADPVTDGTTAGALHRMWIDITSMFENGDEAAAERVEEGEDYLAGKFEEALKLDGIDPATRGVIEEAYREVKEGERFADRLEKQYD